MSCNWTERQCLKHFRFRNYLSDTLELKEGILHFTYRISCIVLVKRLLGICAGTIPLRSSSHELIFCLPNLEYPSSSLSRGKIRNIHLKNSLLCKTALIFTEVNEDFNQATKDPGIALPGIFYQLLGSNTFGFSRHHVRLFSPIFSQSLSEDDSRRTDKREQILWIFQQCFSSLHFPVYVLQWEAQGLVKGIPADSIWVRTTLVFNN